MPSSLELNAQTVRFLQMLGLPLHRDPATSNGGAAPRADRQTRFGSQQGMIGITGNGSRHPQFPVMAQGPHEAGGPLPVPAGSVAGAADPNEIDID